ncbi:unnamed protein product [Microthlaspi erraticum]|uniref:Uncharacterized protein n=1 Tax=Microthlaspi erraticum TaxID=1685480 RepID=A0A6D2HKY8_9BRAS|nr:unnamed protein product [Microthlaspi erraticum]
MDLETENRIASILLREAAELRRQAEKDGIRAYLEKPNVRHRPNSRFLTATVLGVQQSNKAVETSEMWRLRQKEKEETLKRKSREESSSSQMERSGSFSRRRLDKRCSSGDEKKVTHASSSSPGKRWYSEDDEGLGDDDIESFLQSRIKRGRGSIGPRMDETGPYLPVDKVEKLQSSDTEARKVVLGPERPPSLRQHSDDNERGRRTRKDSLNKKDKKTEKKRRRDRH